MKTERVIRTLVPVAVMLAVTGCRRAADSETAPAVSNENEIVLSAESIEAGKIRTQAAGFIALPLTVETTGIITMNPGRLVRIASRASGRIEKMQAFPGDRVRMWAALAELYSPEFLSSQAELLQIEDRMNRPVSQGWAEETAGSKRLLAASVRKLSIMGLSDEEIARIRETGETMPLLPVRAPFAGSILESGGIAGTAVESGAVLMSMADLSTLWVLADLYEKNLGMVQIGAPAEIRTTAYPGESFRGRLTVVGDQADEASRSWKARVEVSNPSLRLKPGMFANVTFLFQAPDRTVCVPDRAVRDLEGKSVVFVQTRPGVFMKREVRPGRSASGQTEILDGLKQGETVAVDGSFILKSEALKAVLEGE